MDAVDEKREAEPRGRAAAGVPGIWQAGLATLLSVGLVGGWALPGLRAAGPQTANGPAILTEVQPNEMGAAKGTLGGAPSLLSKLAQADRGCGAHLAAVTLWAEPAHSVTVRVQSGIYTSPAFKLTGSPVRVAVPFPGSYAAGHGTLRLLAVGGPANVALTPPWHAPATTGASVQHEVQWTPDRRCATRGD